MNDLESSCLNISVSLDFVCLSDKCVSLCTCVTCIRSSPLPSKQVATIALHRFSWTDFKASVLSS